MEIRIPRLGEGAENGTVSNVFVRVGDSVKKDQPILELESEKAVASIPCPVSGKIFQVYVKVGQEVKVGQIVFSIASEEEIKKVNDSKGRSSLEGEMLKRKKEPAGSGFLQGRSPALPKGVPVPPASPGLRKLARELGIDLAQVRGSEKGGRIVMADLKDYVQSLQQGSSETKIVRENKKSQSAPLVDFLKWGPIEKKPMNSLRKKISEKMVESVTTVPQVTQMGDADISQISELRKKYAPLYEKKGVHLTLTPLVLKVLVDVLKKFPVFNSAFDELGQEIVVKKYFHFGIAVDTEQGLIVPVIRNVDQKNLMELSRALNDLVERTKQRKVSIDELQGASFTISNQGGIGGTHFTPIVNKPQTAILGLGKAVLRPVVREGRIEQRLILPLSLSYDHRVIDGADAARFMDFLVRTLESDPGEGMFLEAVKLSRNDVRKKGKV